MERAVGVVRHGLLPSHRPPVLVLHARAGAGNTVPVSVQRVHSRPRASQLDRDAHAGWR